MSVKPDKVIETGKTDFEISSYIVTACRGVSGAGCRFAMASDESFVEKIEQTMASSGWDAFLRSTLGRPINHHNAFKISVAACPNGCSRPHIADVGFIKACEPKVDPAACTECRICEKVCPDNAVKVVSGGPIFDYDECQKCGLCVAKCKEGALSCRRSGYRVVLGGKLGRHPRLATELKGVYSVSQCTEILQKAIAFYMAHYEPRLRFGTLVEKQKHKLMQTLGL